MDDVRQEVYDAFNAMDALVDAIQAEGMTWPLYWDLIDARLRFFHAKRRYDIVAAKMVAPAVNNERYVMVSRVS